MEAGSGGWSGGLEQERKRGREREKNSNMWTLLPHKQNYHRKIAGNLSGKLRYARFLIFEYKVVFQIQRQVQEDET
jgi:hypothetical protein